MSDETTIRVIPVTGETYLRCHYQGQTQPQPCYIELDPEADPPTVRAEYDCEIGGAVPASVWHGRRRRYTIPCMLDIEAEDLMEELLPLLQRVVDGYTCDWDGSNHCGRLTADAREAEKAIEDHIRDLPPSDLQVWDARDWLSGLGSWRSQAEVLGITAHSPDGELEALAGRLREEARQNGVHEIEGLDDYLAELRQWLRDEED